MDNTDALLDALRARIWDGVVPRPPWYRPFKRKTWARLRTAVLTCSDGNHWSNYWYDQEPIARAQMTADEMGIRIDISPIGPESEARHD